VRDDWRDGSKKWDVWSFAAILLECDMDKDEYLHTKDDSQAKYKLRKHIKLEKVCKHLKTIWEGTILKKKSEEMITLEDIAMILHKVNFRKF
jgi:hypothetical protein